MLSKNCFFSAIFLTCICYSYLMHHVYSKVLPAIRDVHARQDQEFRERCRRLRRKLTPSLLGVPEDYDCPYPLTTKHLVSMARVDTPLEMLYSVQDAMVSQAVQDRSCDADGCGTGLSHVIYV